MKFPRSIVPTIGLLLQLIASSVAAQTVIGIVEDGELPRPSFPLEQLADEVLELTGGEFDVVLPTRSV